MRLFLVLSVLMGMSLFADDDPQPKITAIFFGQYPSTPLIHRNGVYAWSGLAPDGTFSPQRAFFHENGVLAWGGLVQGRLTFTSDKAFFNYDNNQKAWGGLYQKKQQWCGENGKFFHRGGQLAWGGLDQQWQCFMSENGKFYHANGEVAWDGVYGSKIYYDNGQVAWEGKPQSAVYDEQGKFIANADFIDIHLGDGNRLYVLSGRHFELKLYLGPGYILKAKNHDVALEVCGVVFDITNDF
jgi:hypothetical protein